MVIGIVGSEEKKFTSETEEKARVVIRELLALYTKVVSGACHLGGIDIWAIEEAKKLGRAYQEFPPNEKSWQGYKARNIDIARASDIIVCITVKTLPPNYKERGWERFCYHCNTDTHIKSGGCWTVLYGKKIGKEGRVIVIE
jgi:hypothetical protein